MPPSSSSPDGLYRLKDVTPWSREVKHAQTRHRKEPGSMERVTLLLQTRSRRLQEAPRRPSRFRWGLQGEASCSWPSSQMFSTPCHSVHNNRIANGKKEGERLKSGCLIKMSVLLKTVRLVSYMEHFLFFCELNNLFIVNC